MQVLVLRRVEGDCVYEPGTVVDATAWKWLDQLLEQRYVRRATEREIAHAGLPEKTQGPVKAGTVRDTRQRRAR